MTLAFVEAAAPDARGPRTHVHLKVVPGGSRDALAGPLGARFKVRVRAPAEGGKANQAVLGLLAEALDVPLRRLSIVRGRTRPLKTIIVEGLDAETVGRLLYG